MAQLVPILCLIPLAALIFRFPELGLVLCLIVGSLFKGAIQPLLGPLDVTVIVFAITYGSIFIRSCMEKKLLLPSLGINIGVLLLVAFFLASLLYTPLPEQGVEVFLRFVFLTISMLYATYMWCNNISRIKRLLFILVSMVVAYGAFAFIWSFLLGNGQLTGTRSPFAETPALGIAQLLAAVIPTAFILRKLIKSKSQRLFLDILLIIGIVELIALNSRGPLIAFLAGTACLFLLYSPAEKKRFALITVPAIMAIVCAFIFLPSQFTYRYTAMVSDPARLDMWQFVVGHFSDWFFAGAGIFGFGYYYTPSATELSVWGAYPHNIFMDVFAAAGFFALLTFIWLIGLLIYEGIKVSRSSQSSLHLFGLATVVALITFLVAGLFSMSIIGTRPLWFLGGIILALYRLSINNTNKTNPEY